MTSDADDGTSAAKPPATASSDAPDSAAAIALPLPTSSNGPDGTPATAPPAPASSDAPDDAAATAPPATASSDALGGAAAITLPDSTSFDSIPSEKRIGPSPGDRTRTSEPDRTPPASSALPPRSSLAPQLRDHQRYDILGEHGRGGLGRVSRAHDRELGRDIAIKELISRGHLGEIRFLREALITARLEHPGIVPVYEAGRWADGTPFYAMKLVAGRPLRDLIAERTTVDDRIALLHHVIAVADAIAYAHGRNIIHRDLKPANVIVGEFGETVVIDWGLAKDLTATEEPSVGGGPVRANRDDGLTSAGAVLGTPAYMAPEQARGESVDQRADVFAIGAMLWELCSLQTLPPGYSGQRRAILRRAGIDPDLITIIEKALDPDPLRRYPDAGALAADLKAFKAGARIAARRYSLWGLLTHWMRRHRVFAVSVAAALLFATAGAVIYIRDIADERDRTRVALQRADVALEQVESSKNELMIKHAELLLRTSPTAAAAAVGNYEGSARVEKALILAEAQGRGVARTMIKPHTESIHWAIGERDGAIVSLASDRHLIRTHEGRKTVLASDASPEVFPAYAEAAHLLAYARIPSGIAIVDLQTGAYHQIETRKPISLKIAPNGRRVGTTDETGTITIWDIPSLTQVHQSRVAEAVWIEFATANQIVTVGKQTLSVLDTEHSGQLRPSVSYSGVTSFEAYPNVIVVGDEHGILSLFSLSLTPIATLRVCGKLVTGADLVGNRDIVAFSCKDGSAGLVRFNASTREAAIIDSFRTDGAARVFSDKSGRQAIFAGQSATVYVYDSDAQLVTRLEGHPGTISFAAAASADFPYVLTGDSVGHIWTWAPPSRSSRLVARLPIPIYTLARFDDRIVCAAGWGGQVFRIDLQEGNVKTLPGHARTVIQLFASPERSSVMSFGDDSKILLWSPLRDSPYHTFDRHTSTINDAAYADAGRQVASVGDDGRLYLWNIANDSSVLLFAHTSPLVALEYLEYSHTLVFEDNVGSLWRWDLASSSNSSIPFLIGRGEDQLLRASLDGRWVAMGATDGTIEIYETEHWTRRFSQVLDKEILQIRFDPKNRDVVLLTKAGRAYLIPLDNTRRAPWREVALNARNVFYSRDGDQLAVLCRDGSEWFYSFASDQWRYFHAHSSEILSGEFSTNGRRFVSSDLDGKIIVHNLIEDTKER